MSNQNNLRRLLPRSPSGIDVLPRYILLEIDAQAIRLAAGFDIDLELARDRLISGVLNQPPTWRDRIFGNHWVRVYILRDRLAILVPKVRGEI